MAVRPSRDGRRLSAEDAELKKALPEYQMHAADIEQATRLAQAGKYSDG